MAESISFKRCYSLTKLIIVLDRLHGRYVYMRFGLNDQQYYTVRLEKKLGLKF